MAPVSAVLFDLDGTLVDTVEDLAGAVNVALERLGRPRRTVLEVRGFIGEGVGELLRGCLGPGHGSLVEEALGYFRPHYLAHCADRSVLYPGVREALDDLSVRPMAVVTNKPKAPSLKLLKALGVDHFFKAFVCGDTLPVRKPDPETVREAARRLGVAPSACVLVGDSAGDVAAARGAGARAVGAAFGYRPEAELRGADALIRRFADLIPLLSEL